MLSSKSNVTSNKLTKYLSTVSVAVLASTHIASAQTAAKASPEVGNQSSTLEEVVVTARRREERLQDVPLSVAAFSSQKIEQLGITDTAHLADFTPGFEFTDYTNGRNDRGQGRYLIFRGLYLSNNTGITSAALVFQDGAPVISGEVLVNDAIDRIEVLKGPQNVYFGRSTFSGAINYVTRNPGNEYRGSVGVEVGNFNEYKVDGHLEGPLVQNKLTASIDGELYNKDGPYTDAAQPNIKIGGRGTKSIAGTLYATPTDDLSIKVYTNSFTYDDGPGAAVVIPSAVSSTCNPGGPTGRVGGSPTGALTGNFYPCGTGYIIPSQYIAQNINYNAIESAALQHPQGYPQLIGAGWCDKIGECDENIATHAIIKYELPDGIKLQSITAYHKQNSADLQNAILEDATHVLNPLYGNPLYPTAPVIDTFDYNLQYVVQDISTEFRASSADDQALRWTIGANYVTTSNTNELYFYTEAGAPVAPPNYHYAIVAAETVGVFGGLYYSLIEDLTLSAEARWQADDRTDTGNNGQVFDKTFRSWSPRLSADYKLNDTLNLYASYAAGVRPGGFNSSLAGLPSALLAQIVSLVGSTSVSYKEEKLATYEIGLKGTFFDHTVRTNISAYKGKLTNEQVAATALTTVDIASYGGRFDVVSNQGIVNIQGVEADAQWKVSRILELSGTMGYNHSEVVESHCFTCYLITGNYSVNGKRLPGAPEFTFTAAADVTDNLTASLNWFGHADVSYKGNRWNDQINLFGTGASTLVNLQAGIENETFSLSAFVTNATNDKTMTAGAASSDLISGSVNTIRAGLPDPRSYGLRFKYKFDAGSMATETKAATYTPPPVVAAAPAAVAHSYQVFFDFNKSDLTPEAVKVVDQAAANAAPAKMTRIDVTGHTDTVGSDAYNMRLSRRRAESVAAELQARGIPSSEIAIFAKGKKDLLVPTADGVREPQNRRVQIVYEGAANS